MSLSILSYLDIVPPILLLLVELISPRVTFRSDYILLFVITEALLNSSAMLLYRLFRIPNLFIYNVNIIVSFLILSAFFWCILHFSRKKLFFTVATVFFVIFIIFNSLKLENFITDFNSNTYGLASFILVTYCFIYYLDKLKHPTKSITNSRDFWYVTGLLTYYASCFFIFISYNSLTNSNNRHITSLWPIHNILFLIMCVYFYKGMLCNRTS